MKMKQKKLVRLIVDSANAGADRAVAADMARVWFLENIIAVCDQGWITKERGQVPFCILTHPDTTFYSTAFAHRKI